MDTNRREGLTRLAKYTLDINHPHYLVYRGLFPDLQSAAKYASGRLLDIGCGNKPYEEMFIDHISEYVGCDITQSSLNRVDVVCQATSIPLTDESFDTVLCTQVIEHVADHQSLLRETHRLLKAGGNLILSGPMYWPLHEEPYDFFRFTEHGLRYLLEKQGFEIISIKSNGGKWAVCGQVAIHTIENTKLYHPITVKLMNKIFSWIDDRHLNYCNPMNYVVTATKIKT